MDHTEQPTIAPQPRYDALNQVPALEHENLYASDTALHEAVAREGAAWAEAQLLEFGRHVASPEVSQWGEQANRNPPQLHTHDAHGRRSDTVEYHPAWHSLLSLAVRYGLHALPWREPRPGAHVARAALLRMASENDFGHACPISMTYAAIPALRHQPELCGAWEKRILSLEYDPRFKPANEKAGALIGMAMTEKQGGSDVRANITRAEPLRGAGSGREYSLVGHKWFCSAPMSDAFLVLAQAAAGPSCFFLPRFLPDGSQNRFLLQRLKDKLGNRSNASSEVEFDETVAWLVGEEGRGIPTILEMVNHTRLDCVIGSCALLRRSLVLAIHHARHRAAFGRLLIDQPLARGVLADLALESEAATLLMLRLARAYDAQSAEPSEQTRAESHYRRITTAIAKYWICKRTPAFVAEALECLGGNGYVESFPLARLYREAPLNSIWEGPGNVICLDVLRALQRTPETLSSVLTEISAAAHADVRLARHLDRIERELGAADPEANARRSVEALALGLQAALLLRYAPSFVADAFCESRLAGDWGHAFGTLPPGVAAREIVDRAFSE